MTNADIAEYLNKLIQKGRAVLETHDPSDTLSDIGIEEVDNEKFQAWRRDAQYFLSGLLGEKEHNPAHNFIYDIQENKVERVEGGLGILIALKDQIQEGVFNPRNETIRESFNDFLHIAQYFIGSTDEKLRIPAASIIGAVLENTLRQICNLKGIAVKKTDMLNNLIEKCNDNSILEKRDYEELQVWKRTRNSADHGNFKEVTKRQVISMLDGVKEFIAKQLEM